MGLEDEVSSLGKGWQINCNSYAISVMVLAENKTLYTQIGQFVENFTYKDVGKI